MKFDGLEELFKTIDSNGELGEPLKIYIKSLCQISFCLGQKDVLAYRQMFFGKEE